MASSIDIRGTSLPITEFRDQRVVTFAMIDKVHGRVEGTAKRNFLENRERMTVGEDYYLVEYAQKDEFRSPGTEVPPRGLTVLTETGYLMLVKSLTDDVAWEVQRKLVTTYFKAKADALTAQQTGGITKAVISKAISELVESTIAPLAEQVRTLIIANDARVAVVDFRPMLSALIDAGVEPKRRRALSQRCSKRCIAWLVNSNRGQFIRESRETGRMLFQVDALNDWMKAEGKTLIRAHLDRLAGQTVINFPKKV